MTKRRFDDYAPGQASAHTLRRCAPRRLPPAARCRQRKGRLARGGGGSVRARSGRRAGPRAAHVHQPSCPRKVDDRGWLWSSSRSSIRTKALTFQSILEPCPCRSEHGSAQAWRCSTFAGADKLRSECRSGRGREDAMPTQSSRRARRRKSNSPALGRAELAAEFLKRNATYRSEHTQMQQRIARGAVVREAAEAAFARRWGLSFRLRAG